MTVQELQAEILRLKKEKDVCILAHSYVAHEILEIADFTGDSFALSQKAATAPQKNVLMVGVRFMAETVKILSPEKTVWLAHPEAGCPMAEQMDKDMIEAVKKMYRDREFYDACAKGSRRMSDEVNWENEFSKLIEIERSLCGEN